MGRVQITDIDDICEVAAVEDAKLATKSTIANGDTYASVIENEHTGNGELLVLQQGHVCDGNTTDIPLAGGATFTGEWKRVVDYGLIVISVKTDQASAVDGLIIQWSPDGINVWNTDVYSILENAAKVFTYTPANSYYRVVYINGPTAQSDFGIEAIVKAVGLKASSHRIQDSIVDEDDAELVKAVLTGLAPDGIFKNVKTTNDGYLAISDNSSGLAISGGKVSGVGFVHKFGQTPNFSTNDGVVSVWDGADSGGIDEMVYTYSSTAAIDSISSDDAGDTQLMQVQGLDNNHALVVQEVTLDGQNRVALTTPLRRVFRCINIGSVDLAGYVYIYENTSLSGGVPTDTTVIRAVVRNGNNQTLMAIYTVPAGKTAYMRDWYASTAGASRTSSYILELRARPFGGVFQLKHISSIVDGGTTYIHHKYEDPDAFLEKTDIEMRVSMTATGGSDAAISAGFDIVMEDNI